MHAGCHGWQHRVRDRPPEELLICSCPCGHGPALTLVDSGALKLPGGLTAAQFRTALGPASAPVVDLRRFAGDLLAVMTGRGVSLRRAAKQAGVTASMLSRLTRYADTPTLDNFARLCRWSGLPADAYFTQPETTANSGVSVIPPSLA